MKIRRKNNNEYHLPDTLSDFQLDLYTHLIDWKWAHITHEPSYFGGQPYDAILPDEYKAQGYPIYPAIRDRFFDHQVEFPFKSHKYLGHMASSQAACANLFLPLLEHPVLAAQVLKAVKPDMARIATEYLDHGFRIEFWDEPDNSLNDHNISTGTDSDFAIAYYDHQSNLNLWLIEHKLSEQEFTTCGGNRSKGRTSAHVCSPASVIIDDPSLCYYQSAKKYRYWDITLSEYSPFNISKIKAGHKCPFMGGMNQLWRNQLLATSIEHSSASVWPFNKVYFSVVHHPCNHSLDDSMVKFHQLIDFSDRFFSFTSDVIIRQAELTNSPLLNDWVGWYRDLYFF